MKKTTTIIFTTFSLLLILDSFNFVHALMMLYLAGVIPGTNIAIGAAQMLEFFALVAGFTVAQIAAYVARSFKLSLAAVSKVQA